jgi:hypothetical protein
MMMTLFGATHAAEKFLCPIRARAVKAIGFFVIDALHFKACMQRIPRAAFVRVDNRSLGNARTDERACPSVRNTAGSERPLRSLITTTALRLPF